MSGVTFIMLPRRSFLTSLALSPLLLASRLRSAEAPAPPSPAAPPPSPPTPWEAGPETLARWRRAPRTPVLTSEDPLAARLLVAIQTDDSVHILYATQTTGLECRTLTPGQLYTVAGFPGLYASGYCHLRAA